MFGAAGEASPREPTADAHPLQPFPGLRLSPIRIGDASLARALSRPYDAVATRLSTWREQGYLEQDESPAIYLHEYTANGMTVRGLVGVLPVKSGQTPIKPHEASDQEQTAELTVRMQQMGLNPAPILLVHRGSTRLRDLIATIAADVPAHAFTDRGEQIHRVWSITDSDRLASIAEATTGIRPVIADGHHRFAAYQELASTEPGDGTSVGLVMLVDQLDTPLFLGAIHRHVAGADLEAVRRAAASSGVPTSAIDADDALHHLDRNTVVCTDGTSWLTLALGGPGPAVAALHDRLLDRTPEFRAITYHHSVTAATRVLARTPGTAFVVPAPDADQVIDAAVAGRLLPRKATSFQPKPSVGVLLRSWR